jgi:hypothetical protein
MSHLSSASNVGVGVTNITVARPAGAGAAHILIAKVWRDFTTGGAMTASADWTAIGFSNHAGFSQAQVNLFWALGDVATLVFSAPSGSGNMKVDVSAFAGRNLATPIADSTFAESTAATTSVPSLNATAGADILAGWADFQNASSLGAAPGGYTDRFNDTTGTFHSAAATIDAVSAGATGAITRSCANFTAKLAAGVAINAVGVGGGGGGSGSVSVVIL